MSKVKERSFYRPHKRVTFDNMLDHPVTGELTVPETRVKQSFRDECDINNILKQYQKTGMIRHMAANAERGMYADLPDEVDFQTSFNIVKQAEEAFASLPSKIRERFLNSPEQFLAFISDPKNQDEAIKMGLATDNRPKPSPEPGNGGAGGKQPPADSAPPAAPDKAPQGPNKGSQSPS